MADVGHFAYLPMARVHYGSGAVRELLSELKLLGANRVMLVTSPSVRRNPLVGGRVESLLGPRLVAVFDGVRPHVPYACLQDGLEKLHATAPDVLVSLGAGSVVDAARALALAFGEGLRDAADLERFRAVFDPPSSTHIPPTSGRSLPLIAVPTTLSAAEFANCGALTSETRGTKDLLIADELTPRVVILDADLAVTTPIALWSSTGLRALDHAIETVYSPRSGPITDALSLDAIRRLSSALRVTSTDANNISARESAQVAAWASYFGEMNLTLGLSHAIGHQIGARHGVQHGWTSCVVLPSVMRWLAPVTAEKQAMIAAAFGVDVSHRSPEEAAEQAAQEVERLVADLALPTSLSDIGVEPQHFAGLADVVMEDLVVAGSPRPVTHGDVVNILQSASRRAD